MNLIRISRIRKLAADEFVSKVCVENGRLVLSYFGEKNRLRGPSACGAFGEIRHAYFLPRRSKAVYEAYSRKKSRWLDEALELLMTLSEKK